MFTESDLSVLKEKGIKLSSIEEQLDHFQKGFPFLPILASASVAKGISCISKEKQGEYLTAWRDYRKTDKQILKFVPASGAASRMFKDLFEFLETPNDELVTEFMKAFFGNIQRFAFYRELNQACLKNEDKSILDLIATGKYKTIIENLLLSKGLNYGDLPKGLLQFHAYAAGVRTAMEEHLVEGAMYAGNQVGQVAVHFTVSPEHRTLCEELVEQKRKTYQDQFGVNYTIGFSVQKPATDTLAVDMQNQPFREDGVLVFRPGGHGALIENLNDVEADVVFIKNIDNIVPDHFKTLTVQYKELIAGVLVSLQARIFAYISLIDSGKYKHDQLMEILHFLQDELCVKNPNTKVLEDVELVLYIKNKLNRPIRVCGMVKNEGEPGGGPFLTINPDGTVSLQILESSQIDLKDPEKKQLFEKGTHFNPVDLVCSLRDYKGVKYHLPNYVDKNTGFISLKSKSGRELKALELPGLWNGAMSNWNTVFVEVPIQTFNPVKTVNDLLRAEHQ